MAPFREMKALRQQDAGAKKGVGHASRSWLDGGQDSEEDAAPFDASDNAAANADDDILDADFEDLGDEKN